MARKGGLHCNGYNCINQRLAYSVAVERPFRRRYIDGDMRPPAEYLIVGRATDKAVEEDLRNKIKYGELLSGRDVQAIAIDVVERDFRGDVDLRGEGFGKGTARELAINRAIKFADFAHGKLTPLVRPKAVQQSWSVRMDGILAARNVPGMKIDLVGTRDIDEWLFKFSDDEPSGIAIHDLKTSRKSPSEDSIETRYAVQMSSYAFGMKVEDDVMPELVQIDCLVDLKGGIEQRTVSGTVSDKNFAWLNNRIENLARHMKAGVFAPAPRDHWVCSKKWCGYFDTCPYVKNANIFDLKVPAPEANALVIESESTEHEHSNASQDDGSAAAAINPEDEGLDLPDDSPAEVGSTERPYLVPRGSELDFTDD